MIDLGDTAGDDLSRAAYNAFTRALSSRKTVNKTNIASGDTDGAIRDVPAYIRDAAARAPFSVGESGNASIDYVLGPDDPDGRLLANPLDHAGIPYSASIDPSRAIATFELSREGGMYVQSLAARYVAADVLGPDRFPDLRFPELGTVYRTFPVHGEESFRAISEALAAKDAMISSEWVPEEEVGYVAIRDDQLEQALDIASRTAASVAAGRIDSPSVDARETAAQAPVGYESIVFQTLDRDPNAEIIQNALRREGVPDNEFTVATPDMQGQVVISIAKGRAPALVQVAESYIDRNLIEAHRFQGLDALRERAALQHESAEMRSRQGDIARARSEAQTIAKGRGTSAPELNRAVTR